MENFNEEKEKFKSLVEALNEEKLKLITIHHLPDNELRTFINQLEPIIRIAEKNRDFVSIVELRQYYLYKADAYLYLNDYASALKDFEKVKFILQDDEVDSEFHKIKCLDGISWSKARSENYVEALKDCNELIACAFKSKFLLSKFFTVRACCYKELGNKIFAERSFELADVNQVFLDRIIREEGDEALPSGRTAIGYNDIGNRYFNHDLFEDALLNYEKAIELNPSYAKAHYNRGVILAHNKNHGAAIQAYSTSIKSDANYVDAYFNRGNEYCYIFDFRSAINDYTVCLIKEPDNELASENLEYAKSMLLEQS
ncbi:MAG: tetratricopeptide repeat protein [Bacteroidia bacterium]